MTKAQEYIDQNFTDKIITQIKINHQTIGQKLTEDLIIQDYPNLQDLELKEHELTSLIITNCPQLKQINVRHNQLTKLEISDQNNALEEIIANSNSLTDLDLSNCQQLKKLMLADNPSLDKIKGLNFTTIKHFNLVNTSFSLEENFKVLKEEITELKTEKDGLAQALKEYDSAGFQKPLVLTESIQTLKQANEAIKRLLERIEKEWRAYLFSTDPNIAENSPTLGAFFQDLAERRKGKKILSWIIQAQTSEDYQELFDKWTNCTEYDYDDSRSELMELLDRKKQLTQ